MISVGEKVKLDFALKVVRDGKPQQIIFAELLTRPTIVSVYMRNNTAKCDLQTTNLAQAATGFDQRGFNVIAISRDTCGSHAKFAAKHGIAFVLASDPEDHFSRAANAIIEKSMYGRKYFGPQRSAYVLDRDGTVLAVIANVDPANHAAQICGALDALR